MNSFRELLQPDPFQPPTGQPASPGRPLQARVDAPGEDVRPLGAGGWPIR